MNTNTLTAVALIAALMPAMSLAQSGPRGPQMPRLDFAAADADASGGISYPEFSAYLRAQMETRRAEALGARADRLIEAGDADGNEALSRDELIAGMIALGDERRAQRQERRGERGERGEMRGERGEMRDERGEMRGERGEMRGERGEMRGERSEMRGERGEMQGHGRGHGNGHGAERGMHGDGGARADRAGWGRGGHGMDPERMANRMFDRIDSDNDGQIDAEELETARQHMQERQERMQERRGNR